jgi:outer-membrane receptor for ferric coprogen and ferric-rhodotorulic acid
VDLGRPPIDVFTFSPFDVPEPAKPEWTDHTENTVFQAGFYGLLRLRLHDRVALAAGLRVSNWHQRLRNLRTGVTTQDTRVGAEPTPYGALSFDLPRAWSLYGSYASVYQPQNSFTWQDELLPPIVGDNYEAGVKGEWGRGALTTSIAYFNIAQTNRAQADPAHPAPCSASPTGSCSLAQGEVRSEGFEAELAGRLSADLDVSAGYTLNTTEYVKDRTATGAPSANEGQPFQTFVPTHIVRIWANYRVPALERRLSLGTGVTASSSQYAVSGAVRVSQGAYGLWNARVAYDLGKRWGIALNANNLLDTTYYRALFNVNYVNHYGEPRSVTLTLRVH